MQQPPSRYGGDIQIEPPTVKSPETALAVEDRSYLAYIASALAVAVFGGFALAVLLPLAETGTFGWGDRVPQLIQAHGWAQLQGWAGLFVAGMAMRLIPRFGGRQPIPRRVTLAILVPLVASVVVRTVVEPFGSGAVGDWLVVLAAALGALGMLGVSAVLAVTLAKGRKRPEPWRFFAWAGAAWWFAWAAFTLGAALRSVHNDRYTSATLDDALTWIVIAGGIGNFVFGVQSRSVPVFFGRKTPSIRQAVVPGALLNFGAALIAASLFPWPARTGWRLEGAGLAAVAVGMLWLAPLAGSIRGRAHRLRPRSRAAARYVLAANLATMAGAACLAWAGGHTFVLGDFEAYGFRDAARHAFGLGMITMLILGMARLVAPVFALERAEVRAAGLVERMPFWLLVAALVLRMGTGLAAGHVGLDSRMHTAAAAGSLAWLALLLFALSVVRAIRAEPRMKQLLASATAHPRDPGGGAGA